MTEESEMQLLKASPPIDVTESGIVTEESDLQLLKAKLPIEVTVFGMVYVADCLRAGY